MLLLILMFWVYFSLSVFNEKRGYDKYKDEYTVFYKDFDNNDWLLFSSN